MEKRILTLIAALLVVLPSLGQVLPRMVSIPAGTFTMGSDGSGFGFDEAPMHEVTISKDFRMSATEITNLQFEQFRPEHKVLRGKGGFSSGDNEAVVEVSYNLKNWQELPPPYGSGMGICMQGRHHNSFLHW